MPQSGTIRYTQSCYEIVHPADIIKQHAGDEITVITAGLFLSTGKEKLMARMKIVRLG